MLWLTFLIAFGLDLLFGDPHSKWHPVALFGSLAARTEDKCREYFGNTVFAGGLGWLLLVGGCTAGAWGAGYLTGYIGAGVILYCCIALRSLIEHTQAIIRPLAAGDLPGARRALGMVVSRDTSALNENEIIRGGVESISENLIDAVNSAVFWAMLGGVLFGAPGAAAGAVLLRTVNTLDASWGYRNARYLKFGRVAARTDDFMHWLPARLTALAVAIASGRFRRTLKTAWKHRHDHPSPNSCWGMAAFAGALGIRLGGPTVYRGEVEAYPYWGNGRAILTIKDLRNAARLCLISVPVFVLFLSGPAIFWRSGGG